MALFDARFGAEASCAWSIVAPSIPADFSGAVSSRALEVDRADAADETSCRDDNTDTPDRSFTAAVEAGTFRVFNRPLVKATSNVKRQDRCAYPTCRRTAGSRLGLHGAGSG